MTDQPEGGFAGVPCPGCKAAELQEMEDRGVPFVGCTRCFGLLVSEAGLGDYVAEVVGAPEGRTAFAQLLELARRGSISRSRRPCPSCGEPLDRLGFGEAPFVVVDRCGADGSIWLDKSELKKVVRSCRAYAAAQGLLPAFQAEPEEPEEP